MKKVTIPIFFSVNDAHAPFLATAILSIKENASKAFQYHFHIFTDKLSHANRDKLSRLAGEGFLLSFHPLFGQLRLLADGGSRIQRLLFPLFISQFFPRYEKVIYLESNLVVPGDISRLYREPLGNKLVGAVADYQLSATEVNPGVLLLNGRRLRETGIPHTLKREHILYLDPDWNAIPSERVRCLDNPQIVHYSMAPSPWPDEGFPFGELFWKYARSSGFASELG